MNQMMSWCQPPGQLERCWNDVQAVEEFLIKAITDILAKNPNAFGTVGALVGVTDGSAAKPGQVGEIIVFPQQSVAIPANAVSFITLTTMGVLPAGDWNIFAWITSQQGVPAYSLDNIPSTDPSAPASLLPPGMSYFGVASGNSSDFFIPSSIGYYTGAGPVTLILRTDIDGSTTASSVVIGCSARRAR